jgi:hypothetical protein
MSDYRDKMRRRMEAKGNNEGESMKNNAYVFADKNFHKSPTYRRAKVTSYQHPEIDEIDVRVMSVERMGDIREVLFRPYEGLGIGSYLEFDEEVWMIYDRYGSVSSGKTKVMVERCTEELRWGADPYDAEGINRIRCVASATQLGSKANQGKNLLEWNKYDVRLALGQIFVFVERNDLTKTLEVNQRFILGSNAYEIVGIDDVTSTTADGYGYIQITMSVTTKRDEDNFDPAFKCAYNDFSELPEDDTGKGGRIW